MANAEEYPILVTRNLVIFPNNSVPLNVASRRNKLAIETALEKEAWILVVSIDAEVKTGEAMPDQLHQYGSLCKVEQVRGDREEGFQVILSGISRIKLRSTKAQEDNDRLLVSEYEAVLSDIDLEEDVIASLMSQGKKLATEILNLSQGNGAKKLSDLVNSVGDIEVFIHLCAAHLEMSRSDKMFFIKTASLNDRLSKILDLLQTRKNSLEIQIELSQKLGKQLDKRQREVILREQMQAIREELGEWDEDGEPLNFKDKVERSAMPEAVKKIALDEIKRLESTPSASPEAPNIRNYVELLLALPWGKPEAKDIDINKAAQLLDEHHHGLDKVKERIIQHLAVMKLSAGQRGTILLLVGPPGVGKTSLGRSIAMAMNREFVRVSLGGVRDEAEIRGHRRTYLGSMPGRIIQGIKRVGVNNPVFLLDEIDKLSQGYSGDPASALLETLDPEQNNTFEDHYLDVPYDLSHVVFIATANSLDGIPAPLRDRMEIIKLSGYTSNEKHFIARRHLWEEEKKKHGLSEVNIELSDDALDKIISGYTKESGVRDLKRKLADICRNLAERVTRPEFDRDKDKIFVDTDDLDEILGTEKFTEELTESDHLPGVVTGLAWTPMGGEILLIESKLMPGKGKLTITGQLGDVMKESLHIAMSHVRANLHKIDIDYDFDKHDIHVHVPSGAIPKDGPSAGITMFSSLVSLIAKRSVSAKLAMSGEITLRGAVLPVGGIKEKVIAAHRAGVEKVLLSDKNRKDLREIPEEIKNDIDIVFVKTVGDVMQEALELDLDFDSGFEISVPSSKSNGVHQEVNETNPTEVYS